MTSGCSISRTLRTNAFFDHAGFTLQTVINCSRSCLRTPAVHHTVSWWPFALIWIYSHQTACCCLFLLLQVLRTILKFASWAICLVAALAASRRTNWCLHSCCVPMIAVVDVAPTNRLDLDPLSPGWGGCVSMTCWCEVGEEDDNKKKWEALRTI